jgi:hypothetical protein
MEPLWSPVVATGCNQRHRWTAQANSELAQLDELREDVVRGRKLQLPKRMQEEREERHVARAPRQYEDPRAAESA